MSTVCSIILLSSDQFLSVRTIKLAAAGSKTQGRNASCCHPELIAFLDRDRVTLTTEARKLGGGGVSGTASLKSCGCLPESTPPCPAFSLQSRDFPSLS